MGAIGTYPPGLAAVRAALLPLAVWVCASTAAIHPAVAGPAVATNPQGSADTAVVNSARKAVANGKLKEAIETLAVYVKNNPRSLGPARYLGDLYYRDANYASAERTYKAILRIAPDDRETHNQLGGVYAFEDRIPEAVAEFTKSLPLPSAFQYLVDLHRRLGDLDTFIVPYETAAEQQPDDAQAQLALGTIYHAMSRNNEAISYLERARDDAPRSCPVLSELGSTYIDVGRYGDAVTTLKHCLDLDPNDYSALVNLGDAYVAHNDAAGARPEFQRANDVRPDGPEAIIDLGYLQDMDGNWQTAVSDYLRALAIQPLSIDAYGNLGYDYAAHHLYSLAEAAYLKGLSISPASGRLHYLLGETYAQQGKQDLATAQYRLAANSSEADVAQAAKEQLEAH